MHFALLHAGSEAPPIRRIVKSAHVLDYLIDGGCGSRTKKSRMITQVYKPNTTKQTF